LLCFVPVARSTQPLRTDYSVMLYCAFGKTRDLSQFVSRDVETEASHVMLRWCEKQVPRHPTRTLLRNTDSCLTCMLRDMEAVASHATLSIWEGGREPKLLSVHYTKCCYCAHAALHYIRLSYKYMLPRLLPPPVTYR